MPGPIENTIREKLTQGLKPEFLEVSNESHMHNVPQGSETHFRVHVVSALFVGKSRVQRQRMVNEILKDEMAPGRVHALAQRALTPDEWSEANEVIEGSSPPCLGGSKK